MTESQLLDEVSRRTGLAREEAQAAVTAVATIACEQERLGQPLPLAGFGAPGMAKKPSGAAGTDGGSFVPAAGEVDDLIAAAAKHPLGVEFLLNGNLCSVAIMFRTHAFTVDAARERLRQQHGATVSSGA